MGTQGQKCGAKSHRDNPEGGDSAFIMESHGRPGLIPRSACPSIRGNKQVAAHAWHYCIIQHFDAEFLQTAPRNDGKGVSIHDPTGGG